MTWIYKIALIVFISAPVIGTASKKAASVDEITRTYDLSEIEKVELDNPFGRIIITETDQPVLSLTAKIKITANREDQAEELMERFSIEDEEFSGRLQISSELREESSIWESFFQKISREVTGTKLQVDYQISMPNNIPLDLTNKYGEVVLPDWEAECWLDIAHGDLSGKKFKDLHGILRASDFHIDVVEEGKLTLKNSEGEIELGKTLEVESSFSEVEIATIGTLEIESTNDKYQIGQVKEFTASGIFSKIKVDHMTLLGAFDLNFGYLQIAKLGEAFRKIDCKSKMADLRLYVDPMIEILFNVEANEKQLDFDYEAWNCEKEYIDENEKTVRIKSHEGRTNLPTIVIVAERGNVDIWKQ